MPDGPAFSHLSSAYRALVKLKMCDFLSVWRFQIFFVCPRMLTVYKMVKCAVSSHLTLDLFCRFISISLLNFMSDLIAF